MIGLYCEIETSRRLVRAYEGFQITEWAEIVPDFHLKVAVSKRGPSRKIAFGDINVLSLLFSCKMM